MVLTDHTDLIARLKAAQGNFCRMNCPHGAEQNWPHDPFCETLRQSATALEALSARERDLQTAIQPTLWQPLPAPPASADHLPKPGRDGSAGHD